MNSLEHPPVAKNLEAESQLETETEIVQIKPYANSKDANVIDSDVFYWNLGAEPHCLDPILNEDCVGANVINQIFEGLVREQEGQVLPAVAESWEYSEDGLVLTFHLRKSNWSDGSPLIANDFIESWHRSIDPKTKAPYGWLWQYTSIKGATDVYNGKMTVDNLAVKALDDYTIQLQLERKNNDLLAMLSRFTFMPTKEKAVTKDDNGVWSKLPDRVVSNGAYKIMAYQENGYLRLVKNPEYWNKDIVNIKEIRAEFIENDEESYDDFQKGNLQFIGQVPPTDITRLVAEEENFHIFSEAGTDYYLFNLEKEFLQDVNIRRALNLGLDRSVIVAELGLDNVPAAAMVAPNITDNYGQQFYQQAGYYGISLADEGVAEAKQLLADAGFADGKDFPKLHLLIPHDATSRFVAETIKEQYKKNLGIDVQIIELDKAEFKVSLENSEFDLVACNWHAAFNCPASMLDIFTSDNKFNYGKYHSDVYDNLLFVATKGDWQEHDQSLYEAQAVLMKDLPLIPLYYDSDYMLVSERLSNWTRSAFGLLDFSEAELQPFE